LLALAIKLVATMTSGVPSFPVTHARASTHPRWLTWTLLNGTAAAGAGPNDLAIAVEGNNSFLYGVFAGTGTLGAFHINGDAA
jgi:hypothetical protein